MLAPLATLQPVAADVRPAHCGNILTLLAHLCDMDDNLRLWILRWLAYPLRNPGAKMATALVLNGGEGSGKSLLINRVVAQLYGDQAATIDSRTLNGVFTSWMDSRRLIVVDEAYSSVHLQRLKSLISMDEVVIKRKGHAPRFERNQLNFVYVSSNGDFMPEYSGRRFTVVEVPPARDRAFYDAVAHEIANGGIEAFRDYLMHVVPMGDFNEFTSPPAPHSDRRAA